MNRKPIILVVNDDGIVAPGIRALIKIMNKLGEVYVVAPDKAQSGMSHAITLETPIYHTSIKIDDGPQQEWKCSGTPVDCVKLALKKILPQRPDICVSGINQGSNASINVLYSGTVSAAVEASIEGIPSIGFSLVGSPQEKDFILTEEYVSRITKEVLKNGLPDSTSLNVNIPKLGKKIKGIKICRQSKARWEANFDERINPAGKTYFWVKGALSILDPGENHDQGALDEGYISIVPVQADRTDYKLLENLKQWTF